MRITLRLAGFALAGLATFFVGVFLTRAIVQLYREPSAWQVLLSFENQDLEGLDEKSSAVLQTAITAVTGHASKNQFHEFFPRIFRTISNTNGEKRYILVEEEPLMTIPGNSWLRVHVFDTAGNLLNEQEFNAGNRVFLTSIQVRRIQMISSDVLIGQGQFDFGGHSLTQYYVLSENQMALVYLELDGLPDTNRYATIGPEIQRSVDEWEKALHSDNDAEVLVALLWLGRHDSNEEPAISIVSSREQVRKRLFELSQSENLWVKAAAQPIISKMMLAAPSQ